ncbi:MAG: 5-keto-L-gluconate epimerase [Victivallaceae bacterium]|nr:5-keto-L-gluconate epimerase [Victivallaceae bacterium]
MKLGIVISTQPTKFSALRYDENLEAGMRQAAALGYDGVELAVREPELLDVSKIKELLDKYGLEVPAIGTGQALVEEGLSFTADSSKIRRAALDRIKSHIDLAEKFKTNVIIGLIRGRGSPDAELNRAKEELMKKALRECGKYARAKNVKLFLEPLNRYESSLVNNVAEGIALIKELSYENLELLIDTFHMNIEEQSFFGSIVKALPHIGHVHFADSNRHAPGSGHIGFPDIVRLLFQAGYNGYISMEMLPLPSADKAAEISIGHLKEIIANIA